MRAWDLILPKNWHEWVYVGSPLTPFALNGGKACPEGPDASSSGPCTGFPKYHSVYIELGSYVDGCGEGRLSVAERCWQWLRPVPRVDNSEPAHNICFRGSSATNRLTIALAYYGNELEPSEPRQIFRV